MSGAASVLVNGTQGLANAPRDNAALRAKFNPATQFFGAGEPMAPIAPAGTTTGRAFDFEAYRNLSYTPRSEAGETSIDFPTMRRMADPAHGGLDLLRLAIETRKDQMAAQRWQIRGRERGDNGGDKARNFEQWLRRPDGVHTFQQWMRILLEDHFVIDAPALFFSQLNGRPLFEPVDGATLKIYIDSIDGRLPLPPYPTFAQIIKGVPAEEYTLDEMGYYPYNVRSNHVYGMSRVEQVLNIVNIALNRQYSQLAYFVEGTVPDGFMEVPKDWSLEEITRFTDWFNSEMSGQLGEKRKIRFVPADAKYVATKTEILKDVFDEWLARIICYCFSLSPQALVKETNRATAQTSKLQAQEEGLEPTKLWFADVMDDLLTRCDAPELQWQWADEEIVDPATKAQVIVSYFGGTTGTAQKIITLEEAREAAGYGPASDEQLAELAPPTPEALAVPAGVDGAVPNGAPAANGNGKNGKNGKKAEPGHAQQPAAGDDDRAAVKKTARGLITTGRLRGWRVFGYERPPANGNGKH